MSNNTPQTARMNRYPGVKPFTTEERDLFFGRERDVDNFYSLLFVKQVVVLYGKSGFGKSSLINAGIIPKLETEIPCRYFLIRFNNFSSAETAGLMPVFNLHERLKSGLTTDQQTHSPLNTLTEGEVSVWHWLKTIQWQHQGEQIILFFDQFEELFTYPPSDVEAFSAQLAEALYTAIPVRYRARLAELDDTGELNDDLHDFLYDKPNLKVVFSVRADRLSLLNNLTNHHPAILQNCYELASLTATQAQAAITEPARINDERFVSSVFRFKPEAVDKIVQTIANRQDGKIETAVLQIVCRYVEETLIIQQQHHYITADDLGDISNIFQQYYEDILQKLTPDDRPKAQELIEEKLITGNLRNALSNAYIRQEFGISDTLLKTLEDSSLLRKERDASGRLLYEVSHDTLVEPIQQVAKVRLDAQKTERQRQAEAAQVEALQAEKKRADQLTQLNQTIRARGRLAWAVAIAAALVAVGAVYFWRSSVEAKKEVQETLLRSNEILKGLGYQKARESYLKAKQLMEYGEYELAIKSFRQAESYLEGDYMIYRGPIEIEGFVPTGMSVDTVNGALIRKDIYQPVLSFDHTGKMEKKLKIDVKSQIKKCEEKLKK